MNDTQNQDVRKGLIVKLCEVMAETGYVAKSGTNQKQGYKYVTEADVLAMLREKLAAKKIFVFPSVVSVDRSVLYTANSGATMFATDVMVKWTFVDGDTGETHECLIPGCGADNGDKGLYKAITGSSKYMFLKGFMLPTGDDPEDETPDKVEGIAAANAVAEKKLADYSDKVKTQVKGNILEYYPVMVKDDPGIAFAPSPALAVMLENGLKDIAEWSETLGRRWIKDFPESIAILEKIGAALGITCKRTPAPSPASPKSTAPVQSAIPAWNPNIPAPARIVSAKVIKNKFLAVTWGDKECSCWHKGLWPAIEAAVGQMASFDVTTNTKGDKTYVNIENIHRIGNRDYESGVPARHPDDIGSEVHYY